MTYEFAGSTYPTSSRMHYAMAEAWLSADGANDIDTMRRFLIELSDEALAEECAKGLDIDGIEGVDLDSLTEAFALVREKLWADEDEEVVVETMPDHLRGSHRAAGNFGSYPHNGAERKIMARSDAYLVIENDPDGYAHIVDEA